MRGVLDRIRLEVKDVVSLKVGDVIVLDKKAVPEVDVYLEGKVVSKAKWQNANGRKVLQLGG